MEPVQLEPSAKIGPTVMFYHQSPWITIAAIVLSSIIVSLSFLVIYTFCDRKRKVITDITLPKPDLGTTITFLGNTEIKQKKENTTQKLQLTAVVLLVLYMIYALLFTFSTMFGVMYLLQNHYAAKVTLASNTSAKLQNWIQSELRRMNIYEKRETLRILNLTREHQEECSCYLNKSLNDAIQKQRETLRRNLLEMYQPNGTIQLTIQHYFQKISVQYNKQTAETITDFNDTLTKNLYQMHTGYAAYVRKVAENGWLEFPREVFLKQLHDMGQNISNVSDKLDEFMAWMEIDKVEEVVGNNNYILNRLLELMPSVDVSSLHASGHVPASGSMPESISWFTFISQSTLGDTDITRPDQTDFQDIFRHPDENITNNMKQILYPVVIGVLVFLDMFILANRFFWALKCLQKIKKGIRYNIPTDSITRKIHFILTGIGYEKTDDLCQFYNEKMEGFGGEQSELYFLNCQASQKSKEDILLEMWSQKQSERPNISTVKKTSYGASKNLIECFQKYTKYLYRLLISQFFWKFTLICAFFLFLCFVTKATDDLVTLEMVSFLTDTETMLNILKSQNRMTNSVIVQYCDHLNKFLREYQRDLDKDLDSINYLIQGILTEQTNALKRIVSSLCSLGRDSTCDRFPADTTTSFLTNCQLLSIQPQLYTGFQERVFAGYVSSQLSPLVNSLRSILFNAVYVLLMFACLMLVCHLLARVIYLCLLKSNWLQISPVYQRPSTLSQRQVQGQAFCDTFDGNQSLDAESCESGVYDT